MESYIIPKSLREDDEAMKFYEQGTSSPPLVPAPQ